MKLAQKSIPKVLVIDDDPTVPLVAQAMIPLEVVGTKTLEEANEWLRHHSPSAILLDIHLGLANSLNQIQGLRRLAPDAPILVVTSDMDPKRIEEALSAGADDFILKPLRSEEIRARLLLRTHDKAEKRDVSRVRFSNLILDLKDQTLLYSGKKEKLSPVNFRLFQCLFNSNGQIIPREALKRSGWRATSVSDNCLHKKVAEVRRILRSINASVELNNVYGAGFQLASNQKTRPEKTYGS